MLGLCDLSENQIKDPMFRPWVWLDIEAYPPVLKLRPYIELVENDGEPMSLDLQ